MKIKNSHGLSIDFLKNGSLRCIEAGQVRISLRTANPFSNSGANIYIRKRAEHIEYKPLLGPESNSRFKAGRNSYVAAGSWGGVDYTCTLQLSKVSLSWQWSVEIQNQVDNTVVLDLIWLQDVGLKPANEGAVNEYYISQYLERRILEDKDYGSVVCCRQNMKETAGNPWVMMACKNRAASASVDGMQFYGNRYRETGVPEGLTSDSMGGEYSGESSVIALREIPFSLPPGEKHRTVFAAAYIHNHPLATSVDDLNRLPDLWNEFSAEGKFLFSGRLSVPEKNMFNTSGFLLVDDLDGWELNRFFGKERRHSEEVGGRVRSFFTGENNHVILRDRESEVDRPHGHIMQAEAGYLPDENIVSTTSFACGVFNSHITQGNTNFNVLLSVCTSQFNLAPETGQRIIVIIEGRPWLLGVPSAFEMGLNHCRWIYKHGNYCFQVRSWTSKRTPRVNMDFKVLSGGNIRLLITHSFDDSIGWNIAKGSSAGEYVAKPKKQSRLAHTFPDAQFRIIVSGSGYMACGDEALYPDYESRRGSLFILDVSDASDFCVSFIGEVCSRVRAETISDADNQWISDCRDARIGWQDLCLNLSLEGDQEEVSAIREILPWYGMNALVHYLTPYGLEQFSGAAWGTRDIAQGPLELLLCLGKYDEAKQVLRIIFSNQEKSGGWAQWWMFDSYSDVRADSSHGDIFYWCLIALGNYFRITGDLKFLGEILPYWHAKGTARIKATPLSEHVDRLINMVVDSFIPGTALVPFGGGDWNDSLQPVSRELAERLISSWTVEMNYQAFSQYIAVYEMTGRIQKAGELKEISARIRADFNKYLIKDGVVAGYGLVNNDSSISLLLHPSDTETGVKYSILPMERGIISGIFTPEQAQHHQDLIEMHLKGPDGARLMDRPVRYKGGIQTLFQRAESSTYFGREIGLMYFHEHIRYAESLALTGRAEAFLKALRQAIPVGYRIIVPCGDIRQSNCYYSSSDAVFRNRYEADELYDEIISGKIPLKGGWRVYSSGPGIFISIIVSRLLGLRSESGSVIFDPVLPDAMDGFSASLNFMGHHLTLEYRVKAGNFAPKAIIINGTPVEFDREVSKGSASQYRPGGAAISRDRFLSLLNKKENIIEIHL
jgi:cellobiose phosphorylase